MVNIQSFGLQAMASKVLAPTNTKGTRIKVTARAGSKVTGWDHALNEFQNHRQAAIAFAESLDWLASGETLATGCLPNGDYCHAILPQERI